jgi:hypothetical protein
MLIFQWIKIQFSLEIFAKVNSTHGENEESCCVYLLERNIYANIFDESIVSNNVMSMARKICNTCPLS